MAYLDPAVTTVVSDAASTTIQFGQDVVVSLWKPLLSIGVLAFAVRFVRRKVGI